MGITIAGSGTISSSTGSVSFDDDNLTTTGTIPAAQLTGTMPALNGAAITALNASNLGSGTVPSARLPAVGKVGQVLTGVLSTKFSSSTLSYVATGCTVTITPAATSSKVFVIATLGATGCTTSDQHTHFALFRAGSIISDTEFYARDNSYTEGRGLSLSVLDSPSTTSATVYEVYAKATAGSVVVNVNGVDTSGVHDSHITVMEILA